MLNKRKAGNVGEDICCEFLEKNGFSIIERNFTSRHGEIDIIAEDEGYIVFAEVKLRGVNGALSHFGRPALAVTKSKMKNIIFTAKTYLLQNPSKKTPRFDVMEIYAENKEDGKTVYRLKHLPSAFRLDNVR